jgi:hypothetical protein
MHFAHQRADESLDVSAEPRCFRRPMNNLNTVLFTATDQGASAKLFCVVQMKHPGSP